MKRSQDYPMSFVKQRASYGDEFLNDEEKEFLWLVRLGDVDEVKTFLEANKCLDYDCCDFRGQRALDIAVARRDIELLEFLLQELNVSTVHYYSAILKSVLERDAEVLELMLDKAENNTKLLASLNDLMSGGPECARCLPEVASTNLTPTMAAAINGDVEITSILLERGYFVHKPHLPNCPCPDHCIKKAIGYETLTESISRMNAYRALSSPCYIILTSEDPILSAFQLSRELEFLSTELPEHQKEYTDLSRQCAKFAADLLNECRNTEEVRSVLVQSKGFNDPRPHRFSRLHLAVQCNQMEFVTHPSCQQVLRSLWVDGLSGWYGWPLRSRIFHVLKHVILTPFVSLAFILIPRTEIISPLKVPLNRFIYTATSYLYFLSMLMLTLLNDRRYDVQTPATLTEVTVCIFVLGHSWDIIVNLFSMGLSNFFRSWWFTFDLVMFSLFLATDVLWFTVFFYNLWANEVGFTSSRMAWSWYHPILLGEGMYATASVLAFCRLLQWCHVHSKLGPLGTSIKYMMGDVARFFVLFFIIMFAFATGINSIYKNYKGSVRILSEDESKEQSEDFLTLKNTFKSLFWAIFGMGEPDFAEIVVGKNISNISMTEEEMVEDHGDHIFTEGIGYGLWGLYHLVTVTVLINMLVAMMAQSYQRVQDNADLEWKFACSMLWLTSFDSHSLVPVPFNLLPSMHRLAIIIHWMIDSFRGTLNDQGGKTAWSLTRCCYWNPDTDIYIQKAEEERYEKLVVQLVRRYLHCKELKESSASAGATVTFSYAEIKEKLKTEILQDLNRPTNLINSKMLSKKRLSRRKTRQRHLSTAGTNSPMNRR